MVRKTLTILPWRILLRLEDAERKIRLDPYVYVPIHQEVRELLKHQDLSDTYHPRGAGLATSELDEAEQTHREWVKDIVDLSDFKYYSLGS